MTESDKKGLDRELQIKANQKYQDSQKEEEKAREWVQELTGATLGEDFWLSFKNGVVLCKLVKAIDPTSIAKFDEKPKHYLEEKANITRYLDACKKIGVPDQDMMDPLDMSDSRKDPLALLRNIYALGRQCQAIGFKGPSLGVRYYKTVEDQEKLKAKREEEKRVEYERFERVRESQKIRRDELEKAKEQRQKAKTEEAKTRLKSRKMERQARGRTKEYELVQHPSVRSEAELQRSLSPVRYGMDLEAQERKEEGYDIYAENVALDWIEEVTQEEVDSLFLHLKSGRTLCKLANKLQRGIIKKINKGKNSVMERENLSNFRQACKMLGLKDHDIFDVNDLYKQEDLGAVINTVHALSRAMENCPTYKGKLIKRGAQISQELVPSIPEESELDKSGGEFSQVPVAGGSEASVSAPSPGIPPVSIASPKNPPQDLPSLLLSPRHPANTMIRIHHSPDTKEKQILSPRHDRPTLAPLTIDVSPVLKASKHDYRELLSPIVKDYIALIQKSRLDERSLDQVQKKLKELENQKMEWEKEKNQLEQSQMFFRRTTIFLGGVVIGVTCSYCLFFWSQKKH